MSEPVFELLSAGKRFGPVPALAGVSLTGGPGERVALRGPNGSGKSTLLKLLAGLLVADTGVVRVLGAPPATAPRVRARIGFCTGDERSLLPRLSAAENLRFFGALYGLAGADLRARIDAVAGEVGLAAELARPAWSLSSGGRAKLLLARALLHSPRLILVDESTHALDAAATSTLRARLCERAAAGACLVFVTHREEEARAIATRTVELARGRVVPGAAAVRGGVA